MVSQFEKWSLRYENEEEEDNEGGEEGGEEEKGTFRWEQKAMIVNEREWGGDDDGDKGAKTCV